MRQSRLRLLAAMSALLVVAVACSPTPRPEVSVDATGGEASDGLPATGGGAVLAGLVLVAGAGALRRRGLGRI